MKKKDLRVKTDLEIVVIMENLDKNVDTMQFLSYEYKKNDVANMKIMKSIVDAVKLMYDCVQELRSRGYSLLQIDEGEI